MFSTFSPRTKFRLQFATHVDLLFKVPRVRDFTKYGKFRIRRHRRVGRDQSVSRRLVPRVSYQHADDPRRVRQINSRVATG